MLIAGGGLLASLLLLLISLQMTKYLGLKLDAHVIPCEHEFEEADQPAHIDTIKSYSRY